MYANKIEITTKKEKKTGDILDKFVCLQRGLQSTSVYSTSWYIRHSIPVYIICL